MRAIGSAFVACGFLLLATGPARAVEGFVIGLEGMRGGFDVPFDGLVEREVSPGEAFLFTAPFADGLTTNGAVLHFGWNVLGHAAIEAALGGTAWSPFDDGRGGLALAGLRATWFPSQLIQPYGRIWDVGLEFGGGYSIAGGPSRGMMGPYYSVGITAEFLPVRWFGVALFYRHHFLQWDTFIHRFEPDVMTKVAGYGAGWGTPGIALNFHLAAPAD